MSKNRTNSDDITFRKSSSGSITINYDSKSRSCSIDSRSYSIDSTSKSRTNSYDSVCSIEKTQVKDKRRKREMKLLGKSPDEPKTIDQIKSRLYIFKK